MGKYTPSASAGFDARLDADLRRLVEEVHTSPVGPRVRGVALSGTYGRGDGGVRFVQEEECPAESLELAVVLDRRRVQRNDARVLAAIAARAAAAGCEARLRPLALGALPAEPFTLANYELKYGHLVLSGDDHCLESLPAYPQPKIPLAEASRLLFRHGAVLLRLLRRVHAQSPPAAAEQAEIRDALLSLGLAAGEAVLIVADRYDLFRRLNLATLRELPVFDVPRMEFIVRGYERAVACLESGVEVGGSGDETAAAEAVRDLLPELFAWCEANRLGETFRGVQDYERVLETRDRAGSVWGNFRQRWRVAGLRLVRTGTPRSWLFQTPRRQLYPAMLRLLSTTDPAPALCRLLGLPQGTTRDRLEAVFLRQAERLAAETE